MPAGRQQPDHRIELADYWHTGYPITISGSEQDADATTVEHRAAELHFASRRKTPTPTSLRRVASLGFSPLTATIPSCFIRMGYDGSFPHRLLRVSAKPDSTPPAAAGGENRQPLQAFAA